MISINRKQGYIILSRCDYLYRDGDRDEAANQEIGDGDIIIPLPRHMLTGDGDGKDAEIIIEEIMSRLTES